MAKVARLSGALLAESEGQYFLVGDTKMPCDFVAEGFEPPGPIEPLLRPFVRLSPTRKIALREPVLVFDVEGEVLARELSARLVVVRNGSVSERLWSLLLRRGEDVDAPESGEVDTRWLGAMPRAIWEIVREAILKCT